MYKIVYSKNALKVLSRIPRNTAEKIRDKLFQLAQDPYGLHNNAKRLEGDEAYRLRVGDWRVIYEIRNESISIFVVKIGARGTVYQ